MLARSYRFHGRGSLRSVYENGKTVRGPQLALRFRPNPRRENYRLAVVVAKKVHRSAVQRNRIRRRIYEAVRTSLPANPPAHDMIVTVFSDEVVNWPAAELQASISELLTSAGMMAK